MTSITDSGRRVLSAPRIVATLGWVVTSFTLASVLGFPLLGVVLAVVPTLVVRRPSIGVVAVVACLMLPNSLLGVGLLWQKSALALLLVLQLGLALRRGGGEELTRLVCYLPASVRHRPTLALVVVAAPFLLGLIQLLVIEPLVVHLSLERTVDYVLGVLVLTCLLVAVRDRKGAITVLWAFTAVASMQAALGLGQAVTGSSLLPSSALNARQVTEATNITGHFRALGTLGHGNSLAIVLVLSLPFVLYLVEHHRRQREVRPAALASILAVVEVLGGLASLSRAGLVAISLMLAAWGLLLSRRTTWRFWRRTLAIAAVGLGLLLIVPQTRSILERFGPGSASSRDAGSGDVRLAVARAAWESFLHRPVLGNGLGSDIELLSRENASLWQTGSHNSYLDLLQGGGTLGLVAFGAFLVLLVMAVSPGITQIPTMYLGLAVVPIYALVESFWNSPILPMLTGTCGVILVLMQSDGAVDQTERVAEPSSKAA